ncbi:MAG: Uma2 family endonuclease [Phormidium tanganyikae FI6-MK23]|jgi:Uma2 family endonuclease|nr:Uma2 family endonuclease [Phormidium tanganyikae FI6-MK23]
MTQAKPRFATFEEYLEFDDGTDNRYELIDGVLVELPPESEPNDSIANYLFLKLVEAGLPYRLVRPGKCELQVPVLQKGDAANCYPDFLILDEVHLSLTRKRFTIKLDMPPPIMVGEVLSPGKTNRERDLIRKRAQYARRGIPEYWLIDPENCSVTVLTLEGDRYAEVGSFGGDRTIISPQYPQLQLTPAQLFEN